MGSIILLAVTNFIANAISRVIDIIIDFFAEGIPPVAEYFGNVTNFLASCVIYVGWWIDALGVPMDMIYLMIIVVIFRFTALNVSHIIKLILKLYNKLKP